MESRRNVIPEASVITDFAITTVNVPDRLDAQEVRARAEAEDDSTPSRRRGSWALRRWLLGGGAAVAVVLAMFGAFRTLSPLWAQVSADGVAEQLSLALGQRVQVANAGVRLAPTPRLVVEGIDVGGQFRIDSVALRFSWASLAKAVQGAGWEWGEATVGPVELSPEGAFALLRATPALSSAVPAPVTSLRFESVRIQGAGVLPARYEVRASRMAGKPFSEFTVADLDSRGRMEVIVSLPATEPARFRLRAHQWRPPFGPAYDWNEASAEGAFAPGRLQVDAFSANGFLGVVTGSLLATRASTWSVRGTVQSTNMDLAAVQREARKHAKLPAEGGRAPVVQGLMDSSGTLSGQGGTLAEALERVSATGRVHVRLATLNGVNLGASAMQADAAGGAGGVTRFGDFEATVDAAPGIVRIRDIVGIAGALRVRGGVGIERGFAVGGVLRAEVSARAGLATADVRVSGSAFEPVFEF